MTLEAEAETPNKSKGSAQNHKIIAKQSTSSPNRKCSGAELAKVDSGKKWKDEVDVKP